MRQEEAKSHPNANIITRTVGSVPKLDLDEVRGGVRAGDVFLLASDGLTRLFNDDEIETLLLQGDLGALGDQLVEMSLARGAPDNLTFIIIRAIADS